MKPEDKVKIIKIFLDELYLVPTTELNFSSNFELLVAVILSAQCTDKRVNQVTEKLFKTHYLPEHFANMSVEELGEKIYSCGFYKSKAKAIIEASKQILEKHNGQVPSTMEELTAFRGVGRKTANVVLSVAYNIPGIAVDTHVFRVSNRLGLVKTNSVLAVEKALMSLFDKSEWSKIHYQLVLFGRYFCKSRNPNCKECKLKNICDYYQQKMIK